MAKYFGEMERILYAAEIYCHESKGYQNCCGCPFYRGCIVGSNRCDKLREILGDHVTQHDPSYDETYEMRKRKDKLRYLKFADSMLVMPEDRHDPEVKE